MKQSKYRGWSSGLLWSAGGFPLSVFQSGIGLLGNKAAKLEVIRRSCSGVRAGVSVVVVVEFLVFVVSWVGGKLLEVVGLGWYRW